MDFIVTEPAVTSQVLEWMSKWEPIWLAAILLAEWMTGLYQRNREFRYDEAKDIQKKQRKTKTTKKTTSNASGTVVEESVETSEPIPESITKGEMK